MGARHGLLIAVLTWGVALAATSNSGQRPAVPGPVPAASRPAANRVGVSFKDEVLPLLIENCLDCHSAEKRKGGLSLATYADVLEGGKDGPVVRPGNSDGSLLIHRITGEVEPQMPKEGVPLTGSEIAVIRRWIDDGA